MLLYIKKADLSLAALGFSYFVCSCMQSIFFNPDAFRCQKAELSLAALGCSYFACSCMQSIFFDPDAFRYQKAELSPPLS